MLLAVIFVSVEKVDSLYDRRIKPQCLGSSTYFYSPSTFMGKLGRSQHKYFDLNFFVWAQLLPYQRQRQNYLVCALGNLDWFLFCLDTPLGYKYKYGHLAPPLHSHLIGSCTRSSASMREFTAGIMKYESVNSNLRFHDEAERYTA